MHQGLRRWLLFSFAEMRANLAKDFFMWRRFFRDSIGAAIVLPSAHGDHKSGIGYDDACAASEIYSKLHNSKNLEIRTSELLGDAIRQHLILIAGKKANPISRDFRVLKDADLTLCLEEGVIYDQEKQAVVTSKFSNAAKSTTDNVTIDYGLIVYTDSPFEPTAKVLQLAGIQGSGTLAAAIAVSEERYIDEIERLINQEMKNIARNVENKTVEILVKVCARDGRIDRDSITLEKITVGGGKCRRKWESREYSQLRKVIPHRMYVDVIGRGQQETPMIKVRIDDQEIKFTKSPDRLKLIYILAKQAREDYLNGCKKDGWLSAVELAESAWQIRYRGGVNEILPDIRREISKGIVTWARNLQRLGKLRLEESISLSEEYVNSEILVSDFDIKKKIVDLVYLINQEEKSRLGVDFLLIESCPGLGYRINIHPALIFLNDSGPAALNASTVLG
jgi:hypothetical protein